MIRDKKNKDSNINLVLIKSIGKTNYNFYIKNKIMKNFFMKELIN